jgi:DNA-binding CsgD family transcriptional regulator
MCAYLKIGLNSKEIADIFQVLPSSINVSRYRLRKKLNLSQEEDLYEFLNSLE